MADLPAAGASLSGVLPMCLGLGLSKRPQSGLWALARPMPAHRLQQLGQPLQAVLQRLGEGEDAHATALQQVPGADQCGGRAAGNLQAGRSA